MNENGKNIGVVTQIVDESVKPDLSWTAKFFESVPLPGSNQNQDLGFVLPDFTIEGRDVIDLPNLPEWARPLQHPMFDITAKPDWISPSVSSEVQNPDFPITFPITKIPDSNIGNIVVAATEYLRELEEINNQHRADWQEKNSRKTGFAKLTAGSPETEDVKPERIADILDLHTSTFSIDPINDGNPGALVLKTPSCDVSVVPLKAAPVQSESGNANMQRTDFREDNEADYIQAKDHQSHAGIRPNGIPEEIPNSFPDQWDTPAETRRKGPLADSGEVKVSDLINFKLASQDDPLLIQIKPHPGAKFNKEARQLIDNFNKISQLAVRDSIMLLADIRIGRYLASSLNAARLTRSTVQDVLGANYQKLSIGRDGQVTLSEKYLQAKLTMLADRGRLLTNGFRSIVLFEKARLSFAELDGYRMMFTPDVLLFMQRAVNNMFLGLQQTQNNIIQIADMKEEEWQQVLRSLSQS
jgi:hypothetical protein